MASHKMTRHISGRKRGCSVNELRESVATLAAVVVYPFRSFSTSAWRTREWAGVSARTEKAMGNKEVPGETEEYFVSVATRRPW